MEPKINTQIIPVTEVSVGEGITADAFREALQKYLRSLEASREEVTGVGLHVKADGAVKGNVVDTLVHVEKLTLPPLEVFIIADEAALRIQIRTHTPVKDGYAVMLVGAAQKNVLVARPGRSLVLRGKMSTFGGPNDTGMTPTEGLAIVRDADIANVPGIRELFPAGTTKALGRSLLNKTQSYIACRWDYKTTPRSFLVKTDVEVRNPATGKSIKARPVDWGPAEWTNRVADLSDFAKDKLGLKTDDICEVVIPLPKDVSGPVLAPVTGDALRDAVVAVVRQQYERYHGVHEGAEPLRSRIKNYWDELKAVAGNDFKFEDTDVPWSAVFVSWCLMQGGVKHTDFGFSPQHSQFIKAAIGRAQSQPQKKYVGLKIDDHAPIPGDVIHWNRMKNTVITYEAAKTNGDYDSHSAIVVAIGEDDEGLCAITVGGNEGQSVGYNRIPLDSQTKKIKQRDRFPFISVIRLA